MSLSRDHLGPEGVARLVLVAGLVVLLAGLPVPIPVRALLETGIMAGATAVTLLNLFRSSSVPLQIARISFLVMLALYVLLLFSSNIPGLGVGLEGIRYTMVALSGLMLGIGLPDRAGERFGMIPVITTLLLICATASLAVHLLAPGYESSLSRSADVYTSLLGGEKRMQGLLSGPFHVSLLGSFLTLAGVWVLYRRRPVGGLLLAVGLAVLLLARVRTGLLATGVGLIVLALIAIQQQGGIRSVLGSLKPTGTRGFAILGAVIVFLIGFGIVASSNVAVEEIRNLPTDGRVESRLDALGDAGDLALESPVVGWGPGTSSTGTRAEFVEAGKRHSTPHSGPLGLMIESGFLGLICFLTLCGALAVLFVREIRSGQQAFASGIATAAVVPVACFWIVGDVLAALPIVLCLNLITGIFLANGTSAPKLAERSVD